MIYSHHCSHVLKSFTSLHWLYEIFSWKFWLIRDYAYINCSCTNYMGGSVFRIRLHFAIPVLPFLCPLLLSVTRVSGITFWSLGMGCGTCRNSLKLKSVFILIIHSKKLKYWTKHSIYLYYLLMDLSHHINLSAYLLLIDFKYLINFIYFRYCWNDVIYVWLFLLWKQFIKKIHCNYSTQHK